MKKLKISKLSRDFRYLQKLAFIGITVNFIVNKTGSLGGLTQRDFALIVNPHGRLDGAIIYQAQHCLKNINPNI